MHLTSELIRCEDPVRNTRSLRGWAGVSQMFQSFEGMLKKAASGVLALLPCSRIESTLRAPKGLRPCWTNFFEHSRQLLMSILPRACMCHGREIFNRPFEANRGTIKRKGSKDLATSRTFVVDQSYLAQAPAKPKLHSRSRRLMEEIWEGEC